MSLSKYQFAVVSTLFVKNCEIVNDMYNAITHKDRKFHDAISTLMRSSSCKLFVTIEKRTPISVNVAIQLQLRDTK